MKALLLVIYPYISYAFAYQLEKLSTTFAQLSPPFSSSRITLTCSSPCPLLSYSHLSYHTDMSTKFSSPDVTLFTNVYSDAVSGVHRIRDFCGSRRTHGACGGAWDGWDCCAMGR